MFRECFQKISIIVHYHNAFCIQWTPGSQIHGSNKKIIFSQKLFLKTKNSKNGDFAPPLTPKIFFLKSGPVTIFLIWILNTMQSFKKIL